MKDIIFASVLVLFFASSAQGLSLSLKHTILSAPLTQFQKSQELLKISNRRTSNIHAQIAPSLSGFFYVELDIGTPPVRANLIFDSGSSLTWVQSAQCKVCFPVAVPNFDPSRSMTYQRMPINHPLCPSDSELAAASKYCSYKLKYYDGQVTHGVSLDTFSFELVDGSGSKQFSDVAFGLGIIN